ncbi:L,D-transpeptidase [uncultured Lactobacillus sp.]|uniref:L,D-transpeptidase n=1 Tax=uncultured Lactobacillus sp. TaxID=153152 RepID=UPI00260FAC97|nr:L,D-transpeptidase [uncultured Lactobacillus sp.]
MKKVHWMAAVTLTALSLVSANKVKAADNNNAQTPAAVQNKNSVVKINYSGKGKVAVWNSYDSNKKLTGNYLANNSNWKSFKVATLADKSQWYNLGGNQWVDGKYILNSSSKVEQKPSEVNNSVNNNWKVANSQGVVKITYSGRGKVAIWNNYDHGHVTGNYLSPATNWKFFKEAVPVNGEVWYNLGGNQWISSKYTNLQKVAKNGQIITTATVNKTSHQPYADPSTLRNPKQWWNSSENKAYPNLKNVKNLWIRVSILGNRTYVMSGNTPVYTMYSSAGRLVNGKSLTPTGTFYVQRERGTTFSGAHYWVSWKDHGVYLFHSTVTNGYNGPYNLTEAAKLGTQPLSHGCIRLTVKDSQWFYNQLPVGTKVVIANN